jgi:molybdate transport system ATP-binding protein
MIQARLRKRFPAVRDSAEFTLDVDFTLSAGISVLFGPSGAGKTLILDCLAGFVQPDEGRILLDDQILYDGQTGVQVKPQQRRCGYVFQNYALFPHMTLKKNLSFAAERMPRVERTRKVAEMLEKFRLTDVAARKPHQVSGGQKQRCSIARALVAGPKLLLLDEPARGLDAPLRGELYEVIRQVRSEFGTPVVLVTHSLEECFELGEQMLIIRDGRVLQSGSPAEIVAQPANLDVAELLGVYNILSAEIRALDPVRKTSVLRFRETDLQAPYFPGHFKGDRVNIVVMPQQLRAVPRLGSAGANQLVANLVRSVNLPGSVRLEFEDFAAEVPRDKFVAEKEWLVEFPPSAIRLL